MEVASFTVKRHLGEVKFIEPSLTSPFGDFYPIEVTLTLWTTIRLGEETVFVDVFSSENGVFFIDSTLAFRHVRDGRLF